MAIEIEYGDRECPTCSTERTSPMASDPLSAALEEIREREQAASGGPWRIIWDSCDCGDGYGCSHGSWPHAIRTGRASTDRAAGEPRDYDYEHSEVADLGEADVKFIAAARRDMPRLLRVAEAVRALCMDTDGGWLPGESQLPVGEFQAALALLDDGLTNCPEPYGPHGADRRCYDCVTPEELLAKEGTDG